MIWMLLFEHYNFVLKAYFIIICLNQFKFRFKQLDLSRSTRLDEINKIL
nr:MAG TPA: hypothetical protein [Caudoviricetes sp.]